MFHYTVQTKSYMEKLADISCLSQHMLNVLKYWIQLNRLSMIRICRQVYEMLLLQREADKQNWVTNVKAVLVENGFGIVWLCQSVGNETHFIVELKDRLIWCYKQNWHSEMESDNKYRYCFIHLNAPSKLKKYLMFITNKWLRGIYARFKSVWT